MIIRSSLCSVSSGSIGPDLLDLPMFVPNFRCPKIKF